MLGLSIENINCHSPYNIELSEEGAFYFVTDEGLSYEVGFVEDKAAQREAGDHDQGADRDRSDSPAAEETEVRGEAGDRTSAGDQVGDTFKDGLGSEGRDQGRDADGSDHGAVQGSDGGCEDQGNDHCDPHVHAHVHHHICADDIDEGDDGTDGKVDSRDQDHEGHTDGSDSVVGNLTGNVDDIVRGEERAAAGDSENNDLSDKHQPDRVGLDQICRIGVLHQTASFLSTIPDAYAMMVSELNCSF